MLKIATKLLKENRSIIIFIVLMGMFRSAFADWNSVPTASMLPTIKEGDRIAVNKLAYDVRIPFANYSLYQHSSPERGDIIVFNSRAANIRLVKRVIGIPGDTVKLSNNHLTLNGQAINYQALTSQEKTDQARTNQEPSTDFLEGLPQAPHQIRIDGQSSTHASFAELTVPKKHYLVLGDNRNNSADSRVYGFVPRDEIIGKSTHVVMSFNYENFYIPRKNRFFKRLDDLNN